MSASNDESRKDTTKRLDSDEKPKTEEWKLENSSLWWLGLDFFQTPANVLMISSSALFMGALYGFHQPVEKMEEWVGDVAENNKSSFAQSSTNSSTSTSSPNQVAQRALERETEILAARRTGFVLASRALGLATLGTLGSFSFLGGVGFYLSGCRSVDEALSCTGQWASKQRQSFEDWMGMDERESKTHPEVIATRNMTEEEEVNYIYDRLMKEIESEEDAGKK